MNPKTFLKTLPKKRILMLSWRDMKHPMKGGDLVSNKT